MGFGIIVRFHKFFLPQKALAKSDTNSRRSAITALSLFGTTRPDKNNWITITIFRLIVYCAGHVEMFQLIYLSISDSNSFLLM